MIGLTVLVIIFHKPLRFTTYSIWWVLLTEGSILCSILCEGIDTNKPLNLFICSSIHSPFIHSINMYWIPIIARHCSKHSIFEMYSHQPLTVTLRSFSFALSHVTFRKIFKLWESISSSIKLRRNYLSDLSHNVVSNTQGYENA